MAKYLLATMWFLSGLALLALPSSALAAVWNRVQFTADTNVHIPGLGITLIVRGGSNVDSLTILDDRIRITGTHVDAANRSSITLASHQRHIVRNSWGLPTTCNPTYSTMTVTWAPTSVGSLDVFPSPADFCVLAGGGGAVSGRMPDPVPSPPPTLPPIPVPVGMTIEEMRAEIVRITALIATLRAQLAERIAIAAPVVAPQAFVSDLHFGMRNNPDVRRLQEFLIQRGHLAPGFNTGNFLSLTREAVRAYQQDRGITPSTGNFGPRTRAAVNAELGVSQ